MLICAAFKTFSFSKFFSSLPWRMLVISESVTEFHWAAMALNRVSSCFTRSIADRNRPCRHSFAASDSSTGNICSPLSPPITRPLGSPRISPPASRCVRCTAASTCENCAVLVCLTKDNDYGAAMSDRPLANRSTSPLSCIGWVGNLFAVGGGTRLRPNGADVRCLNIDLAEVGQCGPTELLNPCGSHASAGQTHILQPK